MRYLSLSKARAELPSLVESVERTVITRSGEPVAVLLNVDDFRALRAVQILAKAPQQLAESLALHADVQRGDFSQVKEFDAVTERIQHPGAGSVALVSTERTNRLLAGIAAKFNSLAKEAREVAEADAGGATAQVAAKVEAVAAEVDQVVRAR